MRVTAYSNEQLNAIWDKTNGRCRYCDKQLAFSNYGLHGARGAWHVDHRRSRANGGTDHLNNLVAACVTCNLDKGPRNGQSYLRPIREEQRSEAAEGLLVVGGLLVLGYLVWKARQDQQQAQQPPWDNERWPPGGGS